MDEGEQRSVGGQDVAHGSEAEGGYVESQSRGERRDGQLGGRAFRDVVGRIYNTLALGNGQSCSSLLSHIECALQCDFVRASELSSILLTFRFAPPESVFGAEHVPGELSTNSRRIPYMAFALNFAPITTRTLGAPMHTRRLLIRVGCHIFVD